MAVQVDRSYLAVKARRKARRHSARATEYVRVAAWLTVDYFRHVRWRLLRVVLSGTTHIALKFAAMGIIYLCVRALSEDVPLAVPGMYVVDPKSKTFILVSVCAGVALLIGTAFFRYDVRQRSVRLGRKYHEFCARRLLVLASRLPHPATELANRIARSGLQQYTGYARYCGMTARALTQLLPTFASFVAVSLTLLWLDLWLTLVLAAATLAVAVALYPAYHRAAAASFLFERTRREVSRRYGALFRRLGRDPTPLPADGPVLKELFRSSDIRDNLESICARASTAEQAALVSRIGSSLLLGGTLIVLGIDIAEGARSWASVAVFLAALRFALSDFVSVCKIASDMNKFHAQIARYREFVVAAAPCLERSSAVGDAVHWPLELPVPHLDDAAGPRLALEPGDVLALVLPGHARPRLQSLLDELAAEHHPDHGFALVDGGLLAPEAKLRANFGLAAKIPEAVIEAALQPFVPEGADLSFATPGWLDRALDQVDPSPPWLLAALQIVALHQRGRPLIAIDFSRFRAMPRGWQDACRATLDDRVLLLIHTSARPGRLGKNGERAALLADGDHVRGWLPLGDRRSLIAVAEAYARLNPDTMATAPVAIDEDDDLD